jgi:hemerythrin superfamily protein
MDPFELLKKDHETVSKLFDRIEAASGKAKLNLFRQIESELEVHTHIEETIFYPAIEQAKETRP